MENASNVPHRIGWVGAGRMGTALAARLLEAGHDVAIYNRTRAKAEALVELGATVVDAPAALADRDIVFTIVSGSADFHEVVLGSDGVLGAATDQAPAILVDMTTISPDASATVRQEIAMRGVALLAAPVSGNPKVVKAGRLTLVVSGPAQAYDDARPLLDVLGRSTYVGDGDGARLAKICHNLMLGVVTQSLAEITVLAEKGGISRAAFLDFLNNSVMGSMFTRYKSPAFVNLDFTPTFTPVLLLKDCDLGMAAAAQLGVPMPLAAATQRIVQALIDNGYAEDDFAALLELQAHASALELTAEAVDVDDGLSPDSIAVRSAG